jgi:YYY domain-containing protein
LGNALWFALSAAGAFGVAANLVLLTKRSTLRAAAFTGALAAIFVTLLGNFEAPLEVLFSAGQGSPVFWRQLDILDLNQPPPQRESFPWPLRDDPGWWYRAAWLIHDYPPDSVSPQLARVTGLPLDPNTTFQPTITEFPQFSFILGDLHPHLLDLPFVLLSLALALNLFLAGVSGAVRRIYHAPLWWLYALLLGGLGFVNTWDFPIYLTLAIVALGLGSWLSHPALSILKEVRDRAIDWLLIGSLGLALYLPFYRSLTSQVAGLWPNVFNGTRAMQFFILFGPFIIIGVLFGVHLLRQQRLRGIVLAKGVISGTLGVIGVSVIGAALIGGVFYHASSVLRAWFEGILLAMNQRGITLAAQLLARAIDPWVPLALALGLSVIGLLWLAARRASPRTDVAQSKDFALLLYGAGLLLALIVESVFIVDLFFTRKNTMFKFDYQVWVLWSVASAYAVYYLGHSASRVWRWITSLIVVGAIGLALIYPALAIATRVSDSIVSAPTLDALQAVAQSPRYPNAADGYAAMQWLAQNVSGTPIILEATDDGPESKPARSRLSSWTGLPTVLGWYGHETQWRGSDVVPRQRLLDITTIYSTPNEDITRSFLQRYAVDYIVVSDRERKQYPAEGLAKFDRMFPIVFQQGTLKIYQVR